ncbi:unnamed protein product [Periconia digitata]|uniref:Uncharacterized protein n=1 Tax=Periconia digitata TaxID=1303443 RepID=A0A9W4UX54_9PLEO|nr:unnamed protein product [Periconia digitata]
MMRSLASTFFALIIGAIAQNTYSSDPPGIAFRLTPYYGIAVIHFENKTSIPVARIHGSPDYQAFMARTPDTQSSGEVSALCRLLPALNHLTYPLNSTIDMCTNADVIHTKALLASLKAATESYLGTNICYAILSLDDPSTHKAHVAQQALGALGLYQASRIVSTSKQFVVAYSPKTQPAFEEEPWPVLAVDYSAHWFNIGLYTIGEMGIVSSVEGFDVSSPRIDEEDQPGALRDALRHLFDHPPIGMELPRQLRHLILYGDDVYNPVLRDILTEVMRDGETMTPHARDLLRDANVSSSVFDGPANTARLAYVITNGVDFYLNAPSAPGCKWRSKLYPRGKSEL